MKYWKRILPLLLVLAMLAGIMVPVAAQEAATVISLNEEVFISVESDDSQLFAFVPETDGLYAFVSFVEYGDPAAIVYDSGMNELARDDDGKNGWDFQVFWAASAGETYYLEAAGYGSYAARVIKMEPETILCDQSVTALGETGDRLFCFVPQTDGWYGFCSSGDDLDPRGIIMDHNGSQLSYDDDGGDSNHFVAAALLEAGKTYYLRAYWDSDGDGRMALTVSELQAAEEICLDRDTIVHYPGTDFYLHCEHWPIPSIPEAVTWTSSDGSVATVDEYGTVTLLSPGSAVITATTENGLTDTVDVEALEAPKVTCGEEIISNAVRDPLWFTYYTFVPETEGMYGFYSGDHQGKVTLEILSSDHGSWASGNASNNYVAKAYLYAGEPYYLGVYWHGNYDEGDSCTAKIEPLVAPTGLELSEQAVSQYCGKTFQLHATTTPVFSTDEGVTWESSNSVVAAVDDDGYVSCLSEGTAVITATSWSGFTASCTVTVTGIPSIAPDETLDVETTVGEPVTFSFTPEESGWYSFSSVGEGLDPYGRILDENNNELEYDDDSGDSFNFVLTMYMDAGVTYLLETSLWDGEGSYQVQLQKLAPATGLELSDTELGGRAGEDGSLRVIWIPALSIPEPLTWSSSDESVVIVYQNGDYELVGGGTATVTATTPSGLSASCTFNVAETVDVKVGDSVTLCQGGGNKLLHFVPETTGKYVFYSTEKDVDIEYRFEDDMHSGRYFGNRFECDLTAGVEYGLWVYPEFLGSATCATLHVDLAQEITAIELSHTQMTGAPDEYLKLDVSLTPLNAAIPELTWTSSNPDVAWVDEEGWIWLSDEGDAVITVTTPSGLTASCQVTCQYPEDGQPIQLGQTVTASQTEGSSWFKFVPQTDGWYCFSVNSDSEYPTCRIYREDWEQIYGYFDEDEYYESVGAPMTAGETYYVRVNFERGGGTGDYTLTAEAMVLPTKIVLNTDSVTGYVMEWIDLAWELQPQVCIPTVTWTSSNEDVAVVTEYGAVGLRSPGTATITATTVNGLTASCTFTVTEPPQLYVGDTVTLNSADESGQFRFIPESDGWYGFYTTGDLDTWGHLIYGDDTIASDDYSGEDENYMIRCQLEAGKCYYLRSETFEYGDEQYTYELHVAALETAQGIAFEYEKMFAFSGHYIHAEYEWVPFLSVSEELTFTSSDETVAIVHEDGWVECLAPGTAVITVTTESGLTDSVTVHVVAYPEDADCYDYCGDNLLWYARDGVLTIIGVGEMLDHYYFADWCGFSSVELPEGMTGIGDHAFRWSDVENVTIPASVTSIGDYAFAESMLSEVRFLGHAPVFGENVFYEFDVTAYYPANDPTWTEEVRQNYGGNVTWIAYGQEETSGVTLQGKVVTGSSGEATVELLAEGEVIATETVSGDYGFEKIAAGTYTLRVSKANHVTREYTVTVAEEDVSQDVKLHLIGDIDGNNMVNIGDLSTMYAHIKGSRVLTDEYQLLCANVNGGKLNMGDFATLYAHITGTKKIY